MKNTFLAIFPLIAGVVANSSVANATTVYNFSPDTAGKVTSFTDTLGALSATFGGQAAVCASGGLFATLTGKVLIQELCVSGESGPLTIGFNTDLIKISFDFATANGVDTIVLAAYENLTPVGSASFTSTIPSGRFAGEGTASFKGVFNNITITGPANDRLAIDNVAATVPEPATATLFIAALGLLGLSARRRFGRR